MGVICLCVWLFALFGCVLVCGVFMLAFEFVCVRIVCCCVCVCCVLFGVR